MSYKVSIALATLIAATSALGAWAQGGGNLNVRTGFGDEFQIHHGLFNLTKETEVKDRLGDAYINKKGLFGTKDTGVNFLGNSYRKHKGIIGGTQVQGADIFGDRISSHKTFLGMGRRQTNVDLSGMGSLVQQFVSSRHKAPMGMPGGMMPGAMGGPPGGQAMDQAPAMMAPANNLDAAAGLGTGPAPTP